MAVSSPLILNAKLPGAIEVGAISITVDPLELTNSALSWIFSYGAPFNVTVTFTEVPKPGTICDGLALIATLGTLGVIKKSQWLALNGYCLNAVSSTILPTVSTLLIINGPLLSKKLLYVL